MLRKNIAWRKAYQADNILKEFTPKEFYLKYIKPTGLGFDKDGDFVLYFPFGKMDTRDILKCTTSNNLERHWIWIIETLRSLKIQRFDKEEGLYRQFHFIIDLDELTFSNTTHKETVSFLTRLLQTFQDNYPEEMKCFAVINAPSYYVLIWSAVKVFMSNAMIEKFKVYGHSRWQDRLLENIDENELPSFLGGTRTDPDGNPRCRTFVTQGGKIPPDYYITDGDRDFKDRSRVTKVTVPPSSVKEVSVEVQEEGSVVHWEVLIQSKDIGFGLFYKEKNGMRELLPMQRINTYEGVDTNYYRAKLVGQYVFIFDNKDSWLNSKEIEYCITVKQEN